MSSLPSNKTLYSSDTTTWMWVNDNMNSNHSSKICDQKIVFANCVEERPSMNITFKRTWVNFFHPSLVKDRLMKYQFCHSFRNNNKHIRCAMTNNKIHKRLNYGLAIDVSALSLRKSENIYWKNNIDNLCPEKESKAPTMCLGIRMVSTLQHNIYGNKSSM